MKWVKKLKEMAPPPIVMGVDLATVSDQSVITTIEAKKPTLEEALEALVDHGFHLQQVDISSSYSFQSMPEIDLHMRICPPPQKHQEVMAALHGWHGKKFYGGKF